VRGPYDALDRLAAHYERHLGERQRAYESAMGWAQGELDAPALITPTAPVQVKLENMPALLLSVVATPRGQLVDTHPLGDPASSEWELTYRLRTEVLVSATDAETTDRWRYAQLTCVREVLLLHRRIDDGPGDAQPWSSDAGPARVLPSFSESYDEVSRGGDNRVSTAQGLIDVDVAVTEYLIGAPGIPVVLASIDATAVAPEAPMPPSQPPGWHPADGPPP
jgi:hypothetical protein